MADHFCATAKTITGAVRNPKRNKRDNAFSLMVASDPASQLAKWAYPPGCLALDRKRRSAAAVAAWARPEGMRARALLGKRAWTPEEDFIAVTLPREAAAQKLNRTVSSVKVRVWRLEQVAKFADAGAVAPTVDTATEADR
ncbi:hypothetical protein CH293_03575 [Rhodococcus sp. 14-2470-1b]|nr:hypothetical protein CH293_03575 [Rhodococcus sp. 14-2470-1b]